MKTSQSARKTIAEEIEAMQIIINIQTIQEKTLGSSFDYDSFNGNSIEELRNLQEIALKDWNNTFKTPNQ